MSKFKEFLISNNINNLKLDKQQSITNQIHLPDFK